MSSDIFFAPAAAVSFDLGFTVLFIVLPKRFNWRGCHDVTSQTALLENRMEDICLHRKLLTQWKNNNNYLFQHHTIRIRKTHDQKSQSCTHSVVILTFAVKKITHDSAKTRFRMMNDDRGAHAGRCTDWNRIWGSFFLEPDPLTWCCYHNIEERKHISESLRFWSQNSF